MNFLLLSQKPHEAIAQIYVSAFTRRFFLSLNLTEFHLALLLVVSGSVSRHKLLKHAAVDELLHPKVAFQHLSLAMMPRSVSTNL